MERKLIGLISSTLAISLLATACSSSTSKESNTKSTQPSSKKSSTAKSKYYFDGNSANIRDLKIKITGVKFYNGLEPKDKKLIAFEYDITNKTNKDIDVNTGWQAVFNAYQDNKNTDGKLEVGATPSNYSNLLDNQSQTIKKNGNLKFVAVYELRSNTTPVILKATKGLDGHEIGQKTFKIGKFENQTDPSTKQLTYYLNKKSHLLLAQ